MRAGENRNGLKVDLLLVRTLRLDRNRQRLFDGRLVSIKIAEMPNHLSQVKPGGLLLAPVSLLMTPDDIAVPMPSSIGVAMRKSPASAIEIRQRHLPSS
jgi:hypothetical protein